MESNFTYIAISLHGLFETVDYIAKDSTEKLQILAQEGIKHSVFNQIHGNNERLESLIEKIKKFQDNKREFTAKEVNEKLSNLKTTLKTSIKALKELKITYAESTILSKINEIEIEIKQIISCIDNKKNINGTSDRELFVKKVEPCPLEDIQPQEALRGDKTSNEKERPRLINSFISTCTAAIRGRLTSLPIIQELSNIPALNEAYLVLKTEGRQLNMTTAKVCLDTIQILLEDKLKYSLSFLSETSTMKHCTLDEFIKIVGEPHEPGVPYVIQIATGTESVLERDHTIVVLINTEGQIEYYDPKGLPSQERTFIDGHTLREGLEKIKEIYLKNTKEILENETPHQNDCHNCGAFVLFYLFQRLIRQNPIDYLKNKSIPINYLNFFRKGFADYIRENYQRIAEKSLGFDLAKQDEEPIRIDEFDMEDEDLSKEKPVHVSDDTFIILEKAPRGNASSDENEFIHITKKD